MPVYCYKCFDCDHYEEIKQKFNDESLTECPKCGGNFRRIIGNVGIIFKGSGFYVTDYKGSKKTTAAPEKKEKKEIKDKKEKKEDGKSKESKKDDSSKKND